MPNYRVNLGFSSMTDSDLVTFAANAIGSLTGNASYPALPVTLAKLENQHTTFGEKVVAAVDGNSAARAARDAARETLLASLRRSPRMCK